MNSRSFLTAPEVAESPNRVEGIGDVVGKRGHHVVYLLGEIGTLDPSLLTNDVL